MQINFKDDLPEGIEDVEDFILEMNKDLTYEILENEILEEFVLSCIDGNGLLKMSNKNIAYFNVLEKYYEQTIENYLKNNLSLNLYGLFDYDIEKNIFLNSSFYFDLQAYAIKNNFDIQRVNFDKELSLFLQEHFKSQENTRKFINEIKNSNHLIFNYNSYHSQIILNGKNFPNRNEFEELILKIVLEDKSTTLFNELKNYFLNELKTKNSNDLSQEESKKHKSNLEEKINKAIVIDLSNPEIIKKKLG